MTLEFLKDLPSKGLLTSVQPGSAFFSSPPLYISAHNTAPDQVIHTDPTSLLLRSIQRRKIQKNEPKKPPANKSAAVKRAADADQAGPSNVAAKKGPGASLETNTASASEPVATAQNTTAPTVLPPTQSDYTKFKLTSKTVNDLKAILKGWGLPMTGKKEDLINRIIEKQETSQGRR